MALILGIDAAWTERGTSGVALLSTANGRRTLHTVASSYAAFTGRGTTDEMFEATQGVPALLKKAQKMAGTPVDIVAIDMPIARGTITGRRAADQAVSKAFGRFGAAVHSPNAKRPGMHGERVSRALTKAGYPLLTSTSLSKLERGTIEVFPLAALVRLMQVPERPPYKVGKIARYWRHERPLLSLEQRISRLLDTWEAILAALQAEITNLRLKLPGRSDVQSPAALKPCEDMLDAIISAMSARASLRDWLSRLGTMRPRSGFRRPRDDFRTAHG